MGKNHVQIFGEVTELLNHSHTHSSIHFHSASHSHSFLSESGKSTFSSSPTYSRPRRCLSAAEDPHPALASTPLSQRGGRRVVHDVFCAGYTWW